MADNRDIRIVVGANIGKTKNAVLEDLRTVANQINSGKSVPRIAFSVNISQTKQNITNELNKIINGLSLNKVNLGFTVNNQKVTPKQANAIENANRLTNEKALTEETKRQILINNQIERSQNKQIINANKIVQSQNKLNGLIERAEKFGYKNSKLFNNKDFKNRYNNLMDSLNSADGTNIKEVNKLNAEFMQLKSNIIQTGSVGQTFGDKLGSQINKLGVYFSAASIMLTGISQVKKTIQSVIELDNAITDLQIATGKTRKETKQLLDTYSEMGKQLGATTLDVANSADSWLRQGYSVEETNKLIKNSLMLSKLGQIDSADATTALTSAMKGYNISVEDSIDIVDKFTSVDMSAAVSAGYLATAMAETATSARLAGVDVNKLVGYIASVGETTQDGAESVGNFMKTLFARMGNIKAGNLIDPESAESLSDVETTLSGLGIKLRSSSVDFRNFGEVLDEVASKWTSYSTVNQRALAVAFSGTRQQEKFLTLMEKYPQAMKYATVSTESAGTALDKYENSYLKSVQASQDNFVSNFDQLSNSIWNSDLIKGTIDAGSGILGFFTTLNKTLGTLPTLVATASGAFSIWKNRGKPNYTVRLQNMPNHFLSLYYI